MKEITCSYIYKAFEHLKQLWMGIWQHIHTITTTEVTPDLGELAEIIDDVSGDRQSLRSFATSSQMMTEGRSHTW